MNRVIQGNLASKVFHHMLNKLKVMLLAVPLLLLIAASNAPECYALYKRRCCAMGDGTPNSGFTPGSHTSCVNSALGSPWTCPTANPAENINLKDDEVWRRIDCPQGGTLCRTQYRNSGYEGKCTQWFYPCSTTVHGLCDALTQANYTCKGHELFGSTCTTYGGDNDD